MNEEKRVWDGSEVYTIFPPPVPTMRALLLLALTMLERALRPEEWHYGEAHFAVSRMLMNLVRMLDRDGEAFVDPDDEVLVGMLVVAGGDIVHPVVREAQAQQSPPSETRTP